jgi:hypothetical protein
MEKELIELQKKIRRIPWRWKAAQRAKAYKQTPAGRAARQENHLKHEYCISTEDYNLMRSKQGCRCPICKRHENEIPSKRHEAETAAAQWQQRIQDRLEPATAPAPVRAYVIEVC